MTKWEYARLESRDSGLNVVFSHRPPWTGLAPEAFFDTLRRLGDEGWELVAALPLSAEAAPAPEREPDHPGPRGPQHPQSPQSMSFHVSTDRWLVFKRPQPEEAAPDSAQELLGQHSELLRGLGRQVLKGRLPL